VALAAVCCECCSAQRSSGRGAHPVAVLQWCSRCLAGAVAEKTTREAGRRRRRAGAVPGAVRRDPGAVLEVPGAGGAVWQEVAEYARGGAHENGDLRQKRRRRCGSVCKTAEPAVTQRRRLRRCAAPI